MNYNKIQDVIDKLSAKHRIPKDTYCIREDIIEGYEYVYCNPRTKLCLLRMSGFAPSFISKILENTLKASLATQILDDLDDLDDLMYGLDQDIRSNVDQTIFQQIHVHFEELARLSGTTYEGAPLRAKIAIAMSIPELGTKPSDFILKPPIAFNSKNFRAIRKFLEGCGRRWLFFSNDEQNKPFLMRGYIDDTELEMLSTRAKLIKIDFLGKQRWEYSDNSSRSMYVDNLTIYDTPVTPEMVSVALRERFQNSIDFVSFLSTLMKQSHGTSILFYEGDDIDDHIGLLIDNNRAVEAHLNLNDNKIDDSDLLAISRIDGAFAVNLKRQEITAFSVILDGNCCTRGNIGRGARYNTLNNFVESYRNNATNNVAAVVISSDGSVEVLPEKN